MKTLLFLALLLANSPICPGQDKAALAQILKSETDATLLVAQLRAYAEKSPWDRESTARLAQRLAVGGIKASEIYLVITASGDMAAALDAGDRVFGEIVWDTAGLLKEQDPARLLYELQDLGVPVFDLIGESLGKTTPEAHHLADDGQLISRGIFGILVLSYHSHYKGLAEKLAIKRTPLQTQ